MRARLAKATRLCSRLSRSVGLENGKPMAIEQALVKRISMLVDEARTLRVGTEHGQVRSDQHLEECSGWVAAAMNVVQLACPNPNSAYWKKVEEISSRNYGYTLQSAVGELSEILKNLLRDIEAGLLTSIADRARAETFDNFLDHGRAYLKEGK